MLITAKDKLQIINDFKKSGSTIISFAPTRNISVSSLRRWIKQYELNGLEGLKTKYEK